MSVSVSVSLCVRACTCLVNHFDAGAWNCYNNQYRKTRRIRRRRRTAIFVHNWLHAGFTCVVLTSAQTRGTEKRTIFPKHTVLLRPLQCGPALCSGRAARRPARYVKSESCHPTTIRTQRRTTGTAARAANLHSGASGRRHGLQRLASHSKPRVLNRHYNGFKAACTALKGGSKHAWFAAKHVSQIEPTFFFASREQFSAKRF